MITARTFTDLQNVPVFRDGLGERTVIFDPATGQLVQLLHVRPAVAACSAFEFALRERVASLIGFRHPTCAPVHRVERRPTDTGLTVVFDYVEGTRLSDLLSVAQAARVDLEISTALCLLRQVVPAVALLHGHARGAAHGLVSPERLIVSRDGRVIVVEHVFGSAIDTLRLQPERLWQEFGAAVPYASGTARLDSRADVMGVGLVALALLLGRPLQTEEVPAALPSLLDEARERSSLGHERPLSAPLRDWLSRALQIEKSRGFSTPVQAARALTAIAGNASLYVTAPISLEMFLARCSAAQAAASFPLPASSCQLPAASAQLPAASSPLAATSAQLPVAGVRPPAASSERPVPSAQPPALPPARALPAAPAFNDIHWDSLGGQQSTAVATAHDIKALLSDAPPPAAAIEVSTPMHVFETAVVHPAPGRWPARPAAALRRALSRRAAVAALLALGVFLGGGGFFLGGGGFFARVLRTGVAADASHGTLVVQTSPAGLQFLIDGVDHGHTPARLNVSPGDHTLEVRGAVGARRIPFTMASRTEVGHYLEFPNPPRIATPPTTAPVSRTEVPGEGTPAPTAGNHAPPAWGWLAVKTAFPLEVSAGRKVIGTTDDERIRMAPGRHEIVLANQQLGYREARVVDVTPGKVVSVVVDPPQGAVNINASPWAEVWIGSRRLGETPLANVAVPVGRHVMVFRHPELGVRRQSVWVSFGEPLRVSMDMR